MKITFEGCECSINFSMGAISFECDPKETEALLNADVRKHEISEGDLTGQVKQCIFACVKDAVGSAMAKQNPKDLTKVPTDKPKPEPAAGAACMPNPNPPAPTAGAACMELQPAPVPERAASMERAPEPTPEKEAKKYGPKRRASAK